MDLFDYAAAREAGETGMAISAANKESLLEHAKGVAVEIGRRQTFVTADDVQFALATQVPPISEEALGNAAGSLFKNKKLWRFDDRYVPCQRESSHGRMLRVWRYIGN